MGQDSFTSQLPYPSLLSKGPLLRDANSTHLSLSNLPTWTFLVVRWVGFHASTAKGPGSIPGQELRAHRLCSTPLSHRAQKKDFLERSMSSRKPFQMDTPQHGMSLLNPPPWPTFKPQAH